MATYIRTGWETGFFQSPNCIFDVKDLKMRDKLCYLYLCRLADSEMKSFPSYKTIGEKMGAGRVTAIEAIKSLEEKGYLKVERRKKSKDKNLTNIYTLVHPDQVIHKGTENIPPNSCSGTKSVPPSTKSVPNKDSLKNKNNIYIDKPILDFSSYDWVNKNKPS